MFGDTLMPDSIGGLEGYVTVPGAKESLLVPRELNVGNMGGGKHEGVEAGGGSKSVNLSALMCPCYESRLRYSMHDGKEHEKEHG